MRACRRGRLLRAPLTISAVQSFWLGTAGQAPANNTARKGTPASAAVGRRPGSPALVGRRRKRHPHRPRRALLPRQRAATSSRSGIGLSFPVSSGAHRHGRGARSQPPGRWSFDTTTCSHTACASMSPMPVASRHRSRFAVGRSGPHRSSFDENPSVLAEAKWTRGPRIHADPGHPVPIPWNSNNHILALFSDRGFKILRGGCCGALTLHGKSSSHRPASRLHAQRIPDRAWRALARFPTSGFARP